MEGASCSPDKEVVLVVDDEADLRELAKRLLARLGVDALEARSGEEALALLKRGSSRIRLMITDLKMPGFGGLELIRQAWRLAPDLTIVCVSGTLGELQRDRELMERGLLSLAKPFTTVEFLDTVRSALSNRARGTASLRSS